MTTINDRSSRFGNGPGGAAGASGNAGGARPAATETAAAGKGGKAKKLVMWLVVLLAAVAAGGYLMMKPTTEKAPTGGDVVVMDAVTLSLAQGHYLKIQVAIQLVEGKAAATTFETSHAAELVIDTFSNRTVDSLTDNKARKQLAAQLLTDIQKAYPGEVFDLYLTQFVLQ